MRLKRLELLGFKSFADRTTFEFGGNSLTGIVGPNGCGKSNVVDSVRWVLGEQRPTSMRGADMVDVIFKGCQSRPSMAVADVTLILDNSAGTLAGHGAEVSITRRVFKSGEGEYLLDGERVRLKDVREMLFDTGLGSRGYSVLEQGKIDAVLSANPLERRRIFEEAAGISRYRQRRVEAELRLKKVAEDMLRLDDVVGELETRVRSLKIQAGKAERWVEAREQWSRGRALWLAHRRHVLARALQELSARLAQAEAAIAELRALREGAEADAGLREQERAALGAEVERLQAQSSALASAGSALDERRVQLANRAAHERAAGQDEGQRAGQLAATLEQRRGEQARLAAQTAERAAESAAGAGQAGELARELAALESGLRELRQRAAATNDETLALFDERTRAENRVRSLSEALPAAQERLQRARERAAQAGGAAQKMRSELSQAGERAREATSELVQRDAQRRALAERLAGVATQSGEAEREKNRLELEQARLSSRIEFLLDRERDLEEIGQAARALLENLAQGQGPCAAEELAGLLADHLRTDSAHARALDTVLGLRGAALVARDEAAARAIAGWLRARESGQLALVLPASARARPLPPAPEAELHQGRLSGHVRCPAGFEALCELLAGDVFVVRDLEAALQLVARHPGLRAVTLEGELVDAAGVLAGARGLVQGAVGRRSSAEDLQADVQQHARDLAALEQRRSALAGERLALQREWELSSQELEARRTLRAQAESELATASARLSDLEAAERALGLESTAVAAEIAGLTTELDSARTRELELRERYERESAALTELERRRAGAEEQRAALAGRHAAAQLEATRTRAEHEGLARRLSDLERALQELEEQRARAARLSSEHVAAAQALEQQCAALAEEAAASLEQRARTEERLGELRGRVEEGRSSAQVLRQRVEAVTRDLERRGEELSSARLELQRLELEAAEILRRAEEELGLEPRALEQGFTPQEELLAPGALEALDAEVREHKARLDKIGPVNMEAMGELGEVDARLSFLRAQRADLLAARSSLDETVRTIDGESKRLFEETFVQVAANFGRIFRQLFGGGRAEVRLEEGVDVLEAGVEIVARPPGREMLSIGLLSGGQRTLTALALLFAVFEARPSPFCILDEVDAALDDANVDRFLGMLAGYRQTTQFVVVTHNKGTMAACDSLYGVTMETKGVSRQVSVELSQAERFATPVEARAARAVEARGELDAESGERVVEVVARSPEEAAEDRDGSPAPELAADPG
jgi:chromosome segregation protein